jgi:hypothetical protein
MTGLRARRFAVEEPVDDVGKRSTSSDELHARIDAIPEAPDPAWDRRRQAETLLALAGGRREPIEKLRSRYLQRLHRASDDFDATEGLRVVGVALSLSSDPEWASEHAERKPRPRWWQRRTRR